MTRKTGLKLGQLVGILVAALILGLVAGAIAAGRLHMPWKQENFTQTAQARKAGRRRGK